MTGLANSLSYRTSRHSLASYLGRTRSKPVGDCSSPMTRGPSPLPLLALSPCEEWAGSGSRSSPMPWRRRINPRAVSRWRLLGRVGQDGAGQEAKAIALQAYLVSLLGEPFGINSAQQGKEHLRRLLAGKACLIVLDDVWDIRDARWMDVVGPQSRILITTRDGSLVADLDAKEYALRILSEDEGATLLAKWSGKQVQGDIAAQEVVQECGRLPLALAICGAMARDGAAWNAIATGLKAADIGFLKRRGIDPYYETVLKSIQASMNFLSEADPEAVHLYRTLAAFPPDESVPPAPRDYALGAGCRVPVVESRHPPE